MSEPKNSKDALEFIHTLDSLAIKKQQEEIERLKAEVERLRASSFVTAVPVEHYERLKQENEELQNRCDFLEGRNKE